MNTQSDLEGFFTSISCNTAQLPASYLLPAELFFHLDCCEVSCQFYQDAIFQICWNYMVQMNEKKKAFDLKETIPVDTTRCS